MSATVSAWSLPVRRPGDRRPDARRAPLSPWRRDLAARYLPLARAMARPFQARWPGISDEFESAACMALVEAAAAFDPVRGVRFSTFCRHRIRGALLDVQRRQLPPGYRDHPDDAPVCVRLLPDAEEHGRVLGTLPADPVGWEVDSADTVEHRLRRLPRRHAAVCRLIYLHGRTHVEVAQHLGISPSRVAFIKAEALSILDGTWAARLRGGA